METTEKFTAMFIPVSHAPGVWESLGFRLVTAEEALALEKSGQRLDVLVVPKILRRPVDVWQQVAVYRPRIIIRSGDISFAIPEEWQQEYSKPYCIPAGIHMTTVLKAEWPDAKELAALLEDAENTHQAERVIAQTVAAVLQAVK